MQGRSESLSLATEVKKLETKKNNLQTDVDWLQRELSQLRRLLWRNQRSQIQLRGGSEPERDV